MKIHALRAAAEIIAVIVISFTAMGVIAAAVSLYASPFGMIAGAAAAVFFIKLRGEPLSGFGFRPAGPVRTVVVVALTLLFMIGSFLYLEPLLERLFGPIDLSIFAPVEGDEGLFLLMLAVSWIAAGFGEEVVYRGFIMTRLAQIFSGSSAGWAFALLFQSALFAFVHAYQGMTGVIQIFIFAALAGAFYLWSRRSLVPLILAHGLLNTFAMTDFYLGGAWTEAIAQLR